ncbi:DNA-binding response OmpR family regulator [Paenibacillus cellulosilyticus]|uniref:DNA-binding response OmpR family regulator n=1 Tax=Paenibacillus cellulosilyticus TaxID=375489 RepID=A0A2V2YVC2_9BACL|nr:response regulator transcription factor [Paenibacillus cellulosilyticus]PWW05172.1 DNA-binding response OmpR family regulator [Paenibacillus cellulosilyticus]
MTNIVLIEDNEQLQKYITEYLSAYGFETHVLQDYEKVLDTIGAVAPKLILLDITLPKFDGFYYLKLIRKHFTTPIIVISARSEESEQIRGIDMGADDYVTKPFSIGVLLAKINAVLRRTDQTANEINVGPLTLYSDTMRVKHKDISAELTKNEFRVLRVLMKNVSQIVTREQLLEELWDDTSFVDDNTLTVNMTRVKKKLAELGLGSAIQTKRGVGYVLDGTSSPDA